MSDITFSILIIAFIVVDIAQIKNRNKHMRKLDEEIRVYKKLDAKMDAIIKNIT